jgi:hypothetical protein
MSKCVGIGRSLHVIAVAPDHSGRGDRSGNVFGGVSDHSAACGADFGTMAGGPPKESVSLMLPECGGREWALRFSKKIPAVAGELLVSHD